MSHFDRHDVGSCQLIRAFYMVSVANLSFLPGVSCLIIMGQYIYRTSMRTRTVWYNTCTGRYYIISPELASKMVQDPLMSTWGHVGHVLQRKIFRQHPLPVGHQPGETAQQVCQRRVAPVQQSLVQDGVRVGEDLGVEESRFLAAGEEVRTRRRWVRLVVVPLAVAVAGGGCSLF